MKLQPVRFALLAFGTLVITGCGGSESKPAAETKPAASGSAEAKPAAGSTAKPKATAGKKGASKVDPNADVDPRDRRKGDK